MPVFSIDEKILMFIQEHLRCSFLDKVFPAFTHLGDAGIFWIVLTLVLLCFKKTRRAGVCSMLALVASVVLNNVILKPLVNRTRPYELIDGLILIGKKADDGSFPSGHAAASIAAAVALMGYLKKRYSIPLLGVALLISFSRLYIGIHYPTDVFAGMAIGILLALLAMGIERLLFRKWTWYRTHSDAGSTTVEQSKMGAQQ